MTLNQPSEDVRLSNGVTWPLFDLIRDRTYLRVELTVSHDARLR